MKTNLRNFKFTHGAPLTAIAVSAVLLVGSVTGANAWHRGYAHQGPTLGGVLGGAAAGALIGGAVKGKKGAAVGAGIGAVLGGAASSRARPAPPPRPTYYPPAPVYGSPMIYDIQSSLTRLGYNPGPIDGVFGGRTADAIGAYEFNSELAVTGQPSEALRYRLRQQAGG